MTVTDILASAQFVINRRGKPTAAVLNIEAWQQLVQWVAEQEAIGRQIPSPVEKLEDLWGDFWPEDEQTDDFIAAIRQWRRADPSLHREFS